MKKFYLLSIFFILFFGQLFCQTKFELEEKRKKTLEEISFVDNLLKETSLEKKESLNDLKIVSRKLDLRENILNGLGEEISLLGDRIDLNNLAIDMMESDLAVLKNDYQKAILNSFKTSKGNSELGFILSSKSFNQGYKRMKYLEQISKFRRNELETISDLKDQIGISKSKLEDDLNKISDLKSKEENQKVLLQSEINKKQKIVKSLGNKEKQLKKELEEKKRIARKIENEIAKVIENERIKSKASPLKPEEKILSDDFYENKGRLPWPVERGIITGHFGIQGHPVLKYVTEDNIDIEITCQGNSPVRSVFKGEVAKVFSIPGANTAVIIRHGKYLTVYQNIVDVKVKAGDKVQTKQEIGKLFNDSENGDKAILKFMVFEEKVKLDPELWISKKN